MGFYKNYLTEITSRGYKNSDKNVCSKCVGDKYLYGMIRSKGICGTCSFCHKKRNVLPMNNILEVISRTIRQNYVPAEGNAIYDSEEKQWMDCEHVIDGYDFIYDELNTYLESNNDEFLKELLEKLVFEDRMRKSQFSESQEQIDMMEWNKYCSLVRDTSLSAEQIIGLINNKNISEMPINLKNIHITLNMIYDYCKELGLVRILGGINSKKKSVPVYRCVNFLPIGQTFEDLSFIPASLVGTAPARNVADNRMSEKGDMMFYGADNIATACKEVGTNGKHPEYPATVGEFYANKNFRILDLSYIPFKSLPSIFDIDNMSKRNAWFFLREFVDQISEARRESGNDNDYDKFYKPTQVFTKYIQRNTTLNGLKFKSSKSSGNCYVIFVVNRDCIDKINMIDKKRNQLIMGEYVQLDF